MDWETPKLPPPDKVKTAMPTEKVMFTAFVKATGSVKTELLSKCKYLKLEYYSSPMIKLSKF